MTKSIVRVAQAVTVTATAKLFDPTNTGGKITLLKGVFMGDTAGTYQLQDGSGGTTVGAFTIAANGQVPFDFSLPAGKEFGAAGIPLTAGNGLYCVGPSGGKATLTVTCDESGF